MADYVGIDIGAEIPPFERRTGLHNWNRYAAVNYEFASFHMDDDAGRAAGYPAAFGMGNLQWAYLHNLLRDWLGDRGRIVELGCRFEAANLKDSVVTAHARILDTRVTDQGQLVELEIWTSDDAERRLAHGSASVLVDRPAG